MAEIAIARMTGTAKRMAEKIPAAHRSGTLEHWSTSISDDRHGCFTFGDDANSYRVYSDGEIIIEPHKF